MVFSSVSFLFFFLTVVIALYFIVPGRFRGGRNFVLLAASLFFYACAGLRALPLLLFSVLLDWGAGLLLPRVRRRKALLAAAVTLHLALLFWFKYAGFAAGVFGIPLPEITLPIGISFFTFQGLSYVVDVYRGDTPPNRSLAQVALYISFFPQLIAGPIVRYTDVALDMNERRETLDGAAEGAARVIFGLGKKCILSNALAELSDRAFACTSDELSAGLAWLGMIAYTLHIYYDFSGYSDMAIGLGRLFGFRLPENFNYPYISGSVTEFWRRWHMTLSGWFRDYLYIPLGGSRRSRLLARRGLELPHLGPLVRGLPDRRALCLARRLHAAARGAEACADAAGRHAGLGLVPRIRPEGGAGLLCRALFRPALVGRGDLLALRALAGAAARRHPRRARISGAQKAAGALELFPRAGRVRPCRELSARRGLQPVHLFQVLRGCGAWKNVSRPDSWPYSPSR